MITFEIIYNKSSGWAYLIFKDGKYIDSNGYLKSKKYALECAKRYIDKLLKEI